MVAILAVTPMVLVVPPNHPPEMIVTVHWKDRLVVLTAEWLPGCMVYWIVEVTVYKTTSFLVVFFFKHKERVVAHLCVYLLQIQMTPSDEHFNQDGGLEVPVCWTAVTRK